MLDTWNDRPAKAAVIDFVEGVTTDGPDFVAAAERVAAFEQRRHPVV